MVIACVSTRVQKRPLDRNRICSHFRARAAPGLPELSPFPVLTEVAASEWMFERFVDEGAGIDIYKSCASTKEEPRGEIATRLSRGSCPLFLKLRHPAQPK
jgi:hypothetical protein